MMNNEQMLKLCCYAYKNKLRELMKPEEYELFTKAVIIEIFRADVLTWNDGDFKQFTLEHIDELCADNLSDFDFIKSCTINFLDF